MDVVEHDTAAALRAAVRAHHRTDEAALAERLAGEAALDAPATARARARALDLVTHVRAERRRAGGVDALMQTYDLSSEEGVTLMCLAEALLRIPDAETTDDFIEDKLGKADFAKHLGGSDSLFVNASTWGLMLAGRTVGVDDEAGPALAKLTKRVGEPVIRQAVRQAMRIMGRQFVMGRTIEAALKRAAPLEAKGYRYSYDMLGEAAMTMADADRYLDSYEAAIDAVGAAAAGRGPIAAPGVSVKLSALFPRYEYSQRDRALAVLTERLEALCTRAARHDVGLCVDAEEAERLDLSLDLIEAAALSPATREWQGFGLAVQAYQRRARAVVDVLSDLAERSGRRLLVRLVKGAYWDTEIKRAQEGGFESFPVFTRKANTDVSYLACAAAMLASPRAFYPCFATHNANTLAAIMEMAGERRDFEFQRLHGMGEALYEPITERDDPVACRIYAPVGGHEDLLAYLVRRLLENGANTSFVNRIADDALPLDEMVVDQVDKAHTAGFAPHPGIAPPPALFGDARTNSAGLDFADPDAVAALQRAITADAAANDHRTAAPIVDGRPIDGAPATPVVSPANPTQRLGAVTPARAEDAAAALEAACAGQAAWAGTPVHERAAILRRAADAMEADDAALIGLLAREGGRTLRDGHLEVREAVDFLRYYAAEAERTMGAPTLLPGPTGETNTLSLHPRGPFLCIAPWNFPLAIFTGQVAAALAAGNTVLAKPAEQTPLIAAAAVEALHAAGVPASALHLLPGDGPTIGGALLSDPRLGGVAFTGSTETAQVINRQLAGRDGPIVPLIAETGGINAMIVDSTALPEQVTRDVLASAFQSAGQRCSALRALCLQEDIAERQLAMIAGAMAELRLGDPSDPATDIGPVIDAEAKAMLEAHAATLDAAPWAERVATAPLGAANPNGRFVAPSLFRVDAFARIEREVFGPILHVVTYKAREADALVDQINAAGYGLTLSVHSRSDMRVRRVVERAAVGNIYVNRNQIGAVVGVQPFGGLGLSGTGPKAGGPHYLSRFVHERTVTVDTTASGGNASLMTLSDA